jgi:hypothetical protein
MAREGCVGSERGLATFSRGMAGVGVVLVLLDCWRRMRCRAEWSGEVWLVPP